MPTYSKLCFSGTSNSLPLLVSATTNPGTVVHMAVEGTDDWDELWIWAKNAGEDADSAVSIGILWGGTTEPQCAIWDTISLRAGSKLVIPGWPIQNSLGVSAFCTQSGDSITLFGYVNRIEA